MLVVNTPIVQETDVYIRFTSKYYWKGTNIRIEAGTTVLREEINVGKKYIELSVNLQEINVGKGFTDQYYRWENVESVCILNGI